MTTIPISTQTNPEVAAVIQGHLRLGVVVTTAETLSHWMRRYPGLEWILICVEGRRFEVAVTHRDRTLTEWTRITRTEPRHVAEDGGPRKWACYVGFGSEHARLDGFQTKIECHLAARGWFIAWGVDPDSRGGWF